MIHWLRNTKGRDPFPDSFFYNLFEIDFPMKHNEEVQGGNGGHQVNVQIQPIQGPPIATMRDCLQPPRSATPSCIIVHLAINRFSFKPGMIPLLPRFHGMEFENPYLHLKEFEDVCSTFHDPQVTEEIIKLQLFPFSLKDKAKNWLNARRPHSIVSWQALQIEFLQKFFPVHRTNALRRQI